MATTIDMDKVFDSSTRIGIIDGLIGLLGLSEEDAMLLFFAALGNVGGKDVNQILRKLRLPKVKVNINRDKAKRYSQLLASQLKNFDKYGVVRFDNMQIVKASENGNYLSVFGAEINPVIYRKMIYLLDNNPEYVFEVLYGLKDALDLILKFVEAIPIETEQ